MQNQILFVAIGSTLAALSLTGSSQFRANSSHGNIALQLAAGLRQYYAGNYLQARELFLATASQAIRSGDMNLAATSLNDAGDAALARQDFRDALADFGKSEKAARMSRRRAGVAMTLNNVASLHLQMGDPAAALEVARSALSDPAAADPAARPLIQFQMATALSRLHRYSDAAPIYRGATRELKAQRDYVKAARVLAGMGSDALDANQVADADRALTVAMQLIREHGLPTPVNVLRVLARVKSRTGDPAAASALFDAAVQAPPEMMPRWQIYADRGEFRLTQEDLRGALADFQEASRLASVMRADIVPADQDRVALGSVLSRVAAGLVESGNRLAQKTGDKSLLRETFDAAEQDRLWSLRALVPAPDDWRTRLPGEYWDVLAKYRETERALLGNPSETLREQASSLSLRLQRMEAAAGGADRPFEGSAGSTEPTSPLARVEDALDDDSVLLSFHVTDRGGWVWAVDRRSVDVYPVPARAQIKAAVESLAEELQRGSPEAAATGLRIYRELFGSIPPARLAHKRWLLEPDGPLFDLPFAALVVSRGTTAPEYLTERAALQVIPGALLLERQAAPGNGQFLGIGDPIYNAADGRFRGHSSKHAVVLPRLSATAGELRECARAWGAENSRLLTGTGAGLDGVEDALRSNPSVIHFATHVVTGPGEYSSGLIALSLDKTGAVGLLGPRQIVAHRIAARLVVLNGCHSAQGDTLPSAGLMGLTRAWIGAGAGAVLATRWDIPDDAGRTFMVAFYKALRAHPELPSAFALQESQIELLRGGGSNKQSLLGAYFLLGRA